jgi:class 3 adenylate cyclase
MERPPQLSSIDVIAASLEPLVPDMGRMSSPDGAITLMLSDMAGADTLSQTLGPERFEQLLRDHRTLVEQLVGAHDGTIVKSERDGFLATFQSAHAGLHAATELQRTFTGAPGGSKPSLRVGLHSGFVIANPEQLLGRNVVLAARIAAEAAAGEILVSSAMKQYTESDPRFRFEPRGEHHFKGVHGEHELFAVIWR